MCTSLSPGKLTGRAASARPHTRTNARHPFLAQPQLQLNKKDSGTPRPEWMHGNISKEEAERRLLGTCLHMCLFAFSPHIPLC